MDIRFIADIKSSAGLPCLASTLLIPNHRRYAYNNKFQLNTAVV